MNMIEQGVIYCVTDSEIYLEAGLISAITLRSFEPDLPITIISNLELISRLALETHNISTRLLTPTELPVNSDFISRYVKTHLFDLSPYRSTLFLDADILPCSSVSDLWKYLDQSAIAMVRDRLPLVEMCDHISEQEKSYTLGKIPPNTVQFNSGVMLWQNNQQMQGLFSQWQEEWQVFQKQDQLALVRALHQCQVSVSEIPQTYNVSPRDSIDLIQAGHTIHLLHCWGGMVASGEFRQVARSRYPEVVENVDLMLSNR
jgi:lipopolysaccharide biosynthesis glycosyltransferase